MRVDPAVTRRKFDIELDKVRRQEATLRGWGCFVAHVEFPDVHVVFVPRNPMRFSVPAPQPAAIVILPPGQMQMATLELPILAGRAFGVRINFDDYDLRALSIAFCDAWTWQDLPFHQLFRASHVDENGQAFNVLLDSHPITKRPFLCLRGTREYHEHPQHTGDDWMLYRQDLGLFPLLNTIWRTCVARAHANLIIRPPNHVEVRWETEMKS